MSAFYCLSIRGMTGLTLVELLLASGLGATLSLGVAGVYLDNRRSHAVHAELLTLQENARFGLAVLRRELTLAGFLAGPAPQGQPASQAVARDCGPGNWALDTAAFLDFVDDFSGSLATVGGADWSCLSVPEVKIGTDLVSIKRSAGAPTLVDGEFPPPLRSAEATQWYLRQRNPEGKRDWVYIGRNDNFAASDRIAGSGVDYWEFYARIFYIRRYSVAAGDGIPALCVEHLVGDRMATDCLVEGVEDLQVEFGLDADRDGVPDLFRSTPAASDLRRTVAIRVHLLMRSLNPLPGGNDQRTYSLGSRRIVRPGDGFYRRVVSTTVSLRNLRGAITL